MFFLPHVPPGRRNFKKSSKVTSSAKAQIGYRQPQVPNFNDDEQSDNNTRLKFSFRNSRAWTIRINIKKYLGLLITRIIIFLQNLIANNKYKIKEKKAVVIQKRVTYIYSSDDSDEETDRKKYLLLRQQIARNRGEPLKFESFYSRLDKFLGHWSIAQLERGNQPLLETSDSMTKYLINSDNVPKIAFTSRLLLLLLQVTVTNIFDHVKHQNDGFKFTPEPGYGKNFDRFINTTLGGFANWDGQYFLHIAVHGYTNENMLAFFPLFPMTLFSVAKVFHIFLGFFLSLSSIILIVGWILNTIFFIETAKSLYKIAKLINQTGDDFSNFAILIFCFNPASIFFSSLYTESLFAFLTTKVLQSLYERKINRALMWASLSAVCRSNGLLNFGFIAIYVLQGSLIDNQRNSNYNQVACTMIGLSIAVIFYSIPFVLFQCFGIWKFCNKDLQSIESVDNVPPYCNYSILPYSYVQQHYWNVGYLRYFELKQIPNFILAFPVLFFQATECRKRTIHIVARCLSLRSPKYIYQVYVGAYGMFLAVFFFLCIHVQVSTRLIFSAFPYLYIFLAETCLDNILAFRSRLTNWPIWAFIIQTWCLLYFIIGSIAFPLNYPWT